MSKQMDTVVMNARNFVLKHRSKPSYDLDAFLMMRQEQFAQPKKDIHFFSQGSLETTHNHLEQTIFSLFG
jgi:hypothetical protein